MSASNASSKVSKNEQQEDIVTIDRRRSERRDGDPEAVDTGVMTSPRRKTQRRRHIDPTTCERDYNGEEIEFMRAMDDYKRDSGRMFPTCSEVLEVVRALGYVKLDEEQLAILQGEDLDDQDDLDPADMFSPEVLVGDDEQ
tara:strand:- start:12051 stop:12473 length:423 start_codon:yes stop_codon:yes gene_type:complete